MREPLPDYPCPQYERPNQPWVCGLAGEGRACPAGPTARGHCPALSECVPTREGDRWQCNRSALRGGMCDDGPTPEGACGRVNRCRPVRSLRAIRGRFVAACTLLTVGGLFALLSADWRDELISPGPLARQHAQLVAADRSPPNCAACHAAADQTVAGWAASLVAGHGDRPDQSQRCMECHDKSISPQFALAAHNLPPEALRKKGSELFFHATNDSEQLVQEKNSSDPFFACATCHREHRGAEFDLTAMNDAACQSCHQRRYESFAADHPGFGEWPYVRRTRIAFDHAAHGSKHFAEKNRAFDCRTCHLDDATGRTQLLASYEAACAACHDERIATSVAQGVPMFVLPTLDIGALTAAGHDVGAWPADATGDFDGRFPSMMKLLLAADPVAAQAIALLGPDFDFFDVDADDAEQLAACVSLAGAIRVLFADLSEGGAVAVRERLAVVLGRELADVELKALVAGLSDEMVREAAAAWFAIADGNFQGRAAELASLARLDPPYRDQRAPIRFDPAGGWQRDDATLSIRYRPAAHADPVLASWLALLAATPDLAERPLALAMFRELSRPTAAGLCASCHSVEQTGARQLAINWRAHDRTTEPRGFTKFSHGPHLVLPQLADCTHCHKIEDSHSAAESYVDWNPRRFVSEFAPLSKQQCVDCHTAKAAGDRCQQCHNYHVDEIESWRLNKISDFGLQIAD